MTTVATDQIVDGITASQHTIIADITTVVAGGDPWGRARMIAMLETNPGSGVFEAVPDWEMRGPGSMDVITNGAVGLKLQFLVLGISELHPAKITIDAN